MTTKEVLEVFRDEIKNQSLSVSRNEPVKRMSIMLYREVLDRLLKLERIEDIVLEEAPK